METTPVPADERRYLIECCRTKLVKEYLPKIEECLAQLTDDDLWWRAFETNNSIGNLMLHLAGNIRQWVFHHLGDRPYDRQREKEFSERRTVPKQELIDLLRAAVTDVDAVLAEFPADRLLQRYRIQKYDVTAFEAILHITEHFSYHTGQIVYITKLRTGKDLRFYNL